MLPKLNTMATSGAVSTGAAQQNQLLQLAAELARLRDAANSMSLAIEDLRFELACAYPSLSFEELGVVVARVMAIAIGQRAK